MTMRLSGGTHNVRNACADAATGAINTGTGTAKLQLRSGAVGATPDTASGTLLAEFSLPNPCFGSSASGTGTANAISDTTGLANGTVGHVRVLDRNGNAVWDNDDVGTSGTQIVLNTTTISSGLTVSVTSWTVTMPAT
jgi:hypothetical protein